LVEDANYTLAKDEVTLRLALRADGAVEWRERAGEVVLAREVGAGVDRAVLSPRLPAGSARLAAYFASERIGRWRGPVDGRTLEAGLLELGGAFWPELRSIEDELGGLVREPEWPGDPLWLLGPSLVLERAAAWEAQGRGEGDDPGARWPFLSWDGVALCVVGALEGPDLDLCSDPAGRLLLFDRELGSLRAVAGSGRVMLEAFALHHELRATWGKLAPIEVDGDIGAELALCLGATRVEEASDRVVASFLGEGIWIRSQAEERPNRAETRVTAATRDARWNPPAT